MTATVVRSGSLVLGAALALASSGMQCPNTDGGGQPQNLEVIVDNRDPGFAVINGEWGIAESDDGNGSWGPDFRYAFADREDVRIARFFPNLTAAGSYAVYIWWSAESDRTTDQPVIVHSATGDTTYHVNLQQNGAQWFLLGHHTFNAGNAGYIEFNTDTADGYCNADAVRLVSDF